MAYDTNRNGPGSYNGFSKEDRYTSIGFYNREAAKARAGRPSILPPKTHCMMCSQTQGILEWHSEDYNWPWDEKFCEWVLCYRCHTMLHCAKKNMVAWLEYVTIIESGWIFPPIAPPRQSGWGVVISQNLGAKSRRGRDIDGDLFLADTNGLIWVGQHDNCLDRMLAAGRVARRRRDELGPVTEQVQRATSQGRLVK